MITISSSSKDIVLKITNEFLRRISQQGGSLFPEYPATYFRNGWQFIFRIGGNLFQEYALTRRSPEKVVSREE
jgi:hypothetical protein